MKVVATKVKAKDLKPGDLFSEADSGKWDEAMHTKRDMCVLGVSVYIRTDDPYPESGPRAETDVFRITIEQG